MSNTPRTDAEKFFLTDDFPIQHSSTFVVPAKLAHELERELNEANAKIAELEAMRDNWRLSSVCRELSAKLDGANADRLRLRAALNSAQHDLITSENLYACDNEEGQSLFQLQHPSVTQIDKALSTPPPPVVAKVDADALADVLKMLRDVVNEQVGDAVVTVPLGYANAALKTYHNKYS